jgi:hypothetical protein
MTDIVVNGKNNISAKVLTDSITEKGIRLTTFELEFHRYILSEHNTHRMLSKNTSSSRAIPVEAMIKNIRENPAVPVHWGENNPGMQSKKELEGIKKQAAEGLWKAAMESALNFASVISAKNGVNAHKQIANRLTECFTMSKVVLTGTEFENMLYLRQHPDAQPEFFELATCITKARELSVPTVLKPGQWHLPYIDFQDDRYYVSGQEVSLEIARKVSASCCAQVSYRKLNDSIDKAVEIFDMLHLDDDSTEAKHASPVEHQATPIDECNIPFNPNTWQPGITHVRRDGSLWSGNLRGWVQYRQLIKNESVQG